jgi:probable addiction module antidote protein
VLVNGLRDRTGEWNPGGAVRPGTQTARLYAGLPARPIRNPIKDFDPAEYMDNKEVAVEYLKAALAENDIEFLLRAIGDIARSRSIVQLSQELNLDRKGLYKAFSEKGNPSFITVVKVLDDLGFRLSVEQKESA